MNGNSHASTEFDSDGSFTLGALEPGDYQLRIELTMAEEKSWIITETVTLQAGTVEWKRDLAAGKLRILPRTQDGVLDAYDGALRWRGDGDLTVRLEYGENNEETRETFYFAVPAGSVQLVDTVTEEQLVPIEVQVAAGKVTVVETP